jgi:hypothetical protein
VKRRKTWLTKAGVEVFSRGRFIERLTRRRGWKIAAYRVKSGAFHGLLWLSDLREVKS